MKHISLFALNEKMYLYYCGLSNRSRVNFLLNSKVISGIGTLSVVQIFCGTVLIFDLWAPHVCAACNQIHHPTCFVSID